jgi:hypothetical protein
MITWKEKASKRNNTKLTTCWGTVQDLYFVVVHIDLLPARTRVRSLSAGVHAGLVPLRCGFGSGPDDPEPAF